MRGRSNQSADSCSKKSGETMIVLNVLQATCSPQRRNESSKLLYYTSVNPVLISESQQKMDSDGDESSQMRLMVKET